MRSVILITSALILMPGAISPWAEDDCDQKYLELADDANKELQYQQRENACEGLFREKKTNDFDIQSFGQSALKHNFLRDSVVKIWFPEHDDRLHLRISVLGTKPHYQLDKIIPKGMRTYIWDLSFFKKLKNGNQPVNNFITGNDIGMRAWSLTADRNTHVPVSFDSVDAVVPFFEVKCVLYNNVDSIHVAVCESQDSSAISLLDWRGFKKVDVEDFVRRFELRKAISLEFSPQHVKRGKLYRMDLIAGQPNFEPFFFRP